MPGAVKTAAAEKAARRRALKKAKKQEVEIPQIITLPHNSYPQQVAATPVSEATLQPSPEAQSETDISANADDFEPAEDDPLYAQFFKDVFGKFKQEGNEDQDDPALKDVDKPEVYYSDDDEVPDEEAEQEKKLSKKARKAQSKLSIAELKAIVKKPELVEWTDTSASDPRLLVAIKSYRNVVPVPSHWSLKREYLSSKRGIEKAPFALPKFIQDTGIAEMRDAVLEKQAEQSLKQKQRERVQPKMGKMDVDYTKLYEAFFRFQTKPELTRYGEVYYEGKEYETDLKHLRPGELGEELLEALNMTAGMPPPWLINQQRYGPPPSYPALKIPGLNAPLPAGAQWGFHAGGFGKPPVDEQGHPLFGGDIYGAPARQEYQQLGEPVEKTIWGELQQPEEESEEEDEEEDEDEDEEEDDNQPEASGISSVAPSEFSGVQSVGGEFTLKKQHHGTDADENHPRSAYQVLPEQATRTQGFFGSDRVYDLTAAKANANVPLLGSEENRRKRKVGDVDVSVDVDALEREDKLSKEEIQKKYERERREQANPWGGVDQDDLSSMIAEESRKRLKKDGERRKH
jgi:splicing factor 3B subunit 2